MVTQADTNQQTADVIVIDDDKIVRRLTEIALSKAGFNVRQAESGESGLALFEHAPADIILLDVEMPDMNGFMVCRALRASPHGEHVPILMITGDDSRAAVEQAFEAGATDFATKPIHFDLLVNRVRYMLRAKQTADQLRDREQSLKEVQQLAGLGSWTFDGVRDGFTCSDILTDILGIGSDFIDRSEFLSFVSDDDRSRVRHLLAQTVDNLQSANWEFTWVRSDRREVVLNLEAKQAGPGHGKSIDLVGAMQDITERRQAESQIRTLAYYDAITGLPNRALSHEHLVEAIELAKLENTELAVLFIDLDHFKRINDTWGHPTGDDVLRTVAGRIKYCLREDDMVAPVSTLASDRRARHNLVSRVGGDEFVAVIQRIRNTEDLASIANRIGRVVSEPVRVQDTNVYISSSIGISLCPGDSEDADSLLKQADGAMHEAKRLGRNCVRFYTEEIQAKAFARIDLEARLRGAVERSEFVLHYQPKISLSNDEVVGLEALVRWQDATNGMIPPDQFIPLAEETGLIVPLGLWILEKACSQLKSIQAAAGRELTVAVNLSALQLKQDNFVSLVGQTLQATDLPACQLELELTESLLVDDVESHLTLLHGLKALGVKISIDDFGTGYSSLSYLKRFPIDTLKIDRSFIQDMVQDRDDAAIVNAAINLAHNLRLRVVAEGVETQDQHELLRQQTCDEVQGYLHCRPLPFEEICAWLKARAQARLVETQIN